VQARGVALEGGQKPCLAEAYHALGRMMESDASLQQAIEAHGLDQAYLIASASRIAERRIAPSNGLIVPTTTGILCFRT